MKQQHPHHDDGDDDDADRSVLSEQRVHSCGLIALKQRISKMSLGSAAKDDDDYDFEDVIQDDQEDDDNAAQQDDEEWSRHCWR